jgi:hypothetical protein
LVGVAVKVTLVPPQIEVAEAPTETAGTTLEFTVMVTMFEVAEVGEAQPSEELIIQLTTSPCAKEALDQLGLLLPTLLPFSSHW